MSNKFSNVPVDLDTTIIFELEAKLGSYPVLYQKWFWSGISAESIIFDSSDINSLDDAQIISTVRSSPLVKCNSDFTIKRSNSGFIFVNFNFDV